MKKKVAVLLVEQDGVWSARSADLLDVYAFGSTREEVCRALEQALGAHLRAMHERGLPLPDFTSRLGRTETDVLGAKVHISPGAATPDGNTRA